MNIHSSSGALGPGGLSPPLPDPIPPYPSAPPGAPPYAQASPEFLQYWSWQWPAFPARALRCGCYLVSYRPHASQQIVYDGTLRIDCYDGTRAASADFYQRPLAWLSPAPGLPPAPVLTQGPDPASGIPVLARAQYRYYMRVVGLLEGAAMGNGVALAFEMWRFDSGPPMLGGQGGWSHEGSYVAAMTWQPAPAGYPGADDYLEGDVRNAQGMPVGRLTMGWISPYLRSATVEIDRVSESEAPLHNGAGLDWKAVGDAIGWDIRLVESDADVAEPNGESWSLAECHAALLARRDASDLDREWRYHVLCVRRLRDTARGVMYDAFSADSNKVPREGCAIASHWTIPQTPEWGSVQGVRFGEAAAAYFRTAVHETGHAMGLYHNSTDNGFMNTTNVIAANSLSSGSPPFPDNIQWRFSPDDGRRLRHMPDIYLRPGGIPFGASYAATPISPQDFEVKASGLELKVTPVDESVPLGAPVRVDIELTNLSAETQLAPASLSMKSGLVRGKVVDPAGTVRSFSPFVLCIEDLEIAPLATRQRVAHSITLLRGAEGALFPMPGAHRVIVEVHWDRGGIEAVVSGETDVMVSSAADEAHAQAAQKVLASPDALLTLILGGDHLDEGIAAIHAALNNPVLRPHFAYIEAKRIAERFGKRRSKLKEAADLIDESTVMSPAEIKRAAGLAKGGKRGSAAVSKIARALRHKLDTLQVDDQIKRLVDAL